MLNVIKEKSEKKNMKNTVKLGKMHNCKSVKSKGEGVELGIHSKNCSANIFIAERGCHSGLVPTTYFGCLKDMSQKMRHVFYKIKRHVSFLRQDV